MDGFKVETTALAQVSADYYAVSERLSDDTERLRRIQETLRGKSIGSDIPELLRVALHELESSAVEARELGAQCEEIADVYNLAEKQVASVVAALSVVSPFSNMPATSGNMAAGHVRVDSPYQSAKPVLFSGNQLPCESWLLDRAIKASMEGEH